MLLEEILTTFLIKRKNLILFNLFSLFEVERVVIQQTLCNRTLRALLLDVMRLFKSQSNISANKTCQQICFLLQTRSKDAQTSQETYATHPQTRSS